MKETPKRQLGTTLAAPLVDRIEAMAQKDTSSTAHVLRKCVVAGIDSVEAEILGAQFAGGKARRAARASTSA